MTATSGRTRYRTLQRLARAMIALTVALSPLTRVDPGVAIADGLADEADLHFQLGAERYQQGDFRGALEQFLISNRLVPNRNVVYNIARCFEQLKRYADAHRYYVDALIGETDPQTIKAVEASIARVVPNVAVLDIASSPPGATIYIDRKDLGSRGRAPRLLALPEGRYRIIAELDGFEPRVIENVDAKLGQKVRLEVPLTRIVGTVHVGVKGLKDAKGVAVRVDDERAPPSCTAPCALSLPPGTHQLYFAREGYQAPPLQVNVVAQQESSVTAVVSPVTGSVVVSADESGVLITVDDAPVGFTPTVLQNVPVGRRKIGLRMRGYTPVEREIEVRPNEQSMLTDVPLDPLREVTAVSRYSERIEDAPSSVSIIDGQELRAFGYPTIGEALRGQRGVYLSNDRSYLSAGIRGLGEPNDYGNRVLLLADGQPLNDNLLASSYIGSDARVDLHDIDRIEVVRGPGSLLYGTGAFSGVINLVTRPRDEPTSVHAGAGVYDDSVMHARAGFNYRLGPNRGVWASVSGARSEGFDLTLTQKDPDADPRVVTANHVEKLASGGTQGRAWWGPLTAQWYFHERTQILTAGPYQTRINDTRSSITDTRYMGEVRFEPKISDAVQLMTRAHANRYAFHADYSYEPEPEQPGQEDLTGTWFGAEARVIFTPRPWARLTVGAEGQIHPEATLLGHESDAGATYLDADQPYKFGAAYGLVEASPLSFLRVSGGVRVDVYEEFTTVLPRAGLIIKPVTGGVLKVLGGRAFRAPSIYELYYSDGGISQIPAVNGAGRTLQPESVYSGEVEYSQRFLEDWVALGAVHASHVAGIITTRPDAPGSNLVRYVNSEDPALALGGDVELRREWRHGWMLSAMYGYQRTVFLDRSLDNPRLINAPEHLASFRAVLPAVRDLASFGVRATLEAPRRITLDSDETTPGGIVADATVSGNIRQFGLHYTVGIYNITDQRYEIPVTDTFRSRTMPQNGRTLRIDFLVTYP